VGHWGTRLSFLYVTQHLPLEVSACRHCLFCFRCRNTNTLCVFVVAAAVVVVVAAVAAAPAAPAVAVVFLAETFCAFLSLVVQNLHVPLSRPLAAAASSSSSSSDYEFPTWETPLREHLLLEYAYYLSTQAAMWRIAVRCDRLAARLPVVSCVGVCLVDTDPTIAPLSHSAQ
jgi:hypothetical protein